MKRPTITNQRAAERAKPHPDGKPIIRYRVAPTLFLTVQANGVKFWEQRITIDGRESSYGLGGIDLINYTRANRIALDNNYACAIDTSGSQPEVLHLGVWDD